MELDIRQTCNEIFILLSRYEQDMEDKKFKEADIAAGHAKKLMNDLHNKAWHSFNCSGRVGK